MAESRRAYRFIFEKVKPGVLYADKIDVASDARCVLIYRDGRIAGVIPCERIHYLVEEDASRPAEGKSSR